MLPDIFTQRCVDARLVFVAPRSEPREQIGIDPKCDLFFHGAVEASSDSIIPIGDLWDVGRVDRLFILPCEAAQFFGLLLRNSVHIYVSRSAWPCARR